MPKAIAITDSAPAAGVEVDLWGTVFNAVPITRSRQALLEELERELGELDEDDPKGPDKLIQILAKMIDAQVSPAGGRKKNASDFITEKWEKDELTTDQLMLFRQRLVEAVRPT